ncbi:hypothetical protein ACFV9D_29480 [Streptomyces sp. NPDC059875]|uniref:hypothetical protein n=1 Tax=unclassified Streptomyces TaxID=2593676 RepID=UPI00366028FA
MDNTLRGKPEITDGDINTADAFVPADEWDGFPVNTFDDLGNPPPRNEPPTVTVTPGGGCGNNRSGTLNLLVADPDNDATGLTLSASSSNPALLPAGNVTFAGAGENRTVTVTVTVTATVLPDVTGTAVLTITVSDGEATGPPRPS